MAGLGLVDCRQLDKACHVNRLLRSVLNCIGLFLCIKVPHLYKKSPITFVIKIMIHYPTYVLHEAITPFAL